ncbi:MAG TPA: alpha-galactosidase [Actinomycetota bacterium]|nr:alpha-galactosidase [Actinomycetota bacterium]
MDRREFLRRSVAGLAFPGVSAILASCDPAPPDGNVDAAQRTSTADARSLAPTPPMGWNSWNVYGPGIHEGRILATADAMVDSGMRDAGWEYVLLDDGWQRVRGPRFLHDLEHDPDKFPRGIGFLADSVHEHGLKLGIYSGPGVETCAGYTGSGGHEREDAELSPRGASTT